MKFEGKRTTPGQESRRRAQQAQEAKHGGHRRPTAQASGDPAQDASGGAGGPPPIVTVAQRKAAKRAGAGAGGLTTWTNATWLPVKTPHILWTAVFDPPPPPPIADAGIRVGEIIGYRVWRIDPTGYLRSGFRKTLWLPGVTVTGTPGDRDQEGVHAFKALDHRISDAAQEYNIGPRDLKKRNDLAALMLEPNFDFEPRGMAIGTVALWGTVLEHEHGYRAQYARVETIESVIARDIRDHGALLAQIRAAYCPPPPAADMNAAA